MAGRKREGIDDKTELLHLLTKREALRPAHEEYEEVDRELKARIRGRSRLLVGDRLITGKWIERAAYQVDGGRQWLAKIAKRSDNPRS